LKVATRGKNLCVNIIGVKEVDAGHQPFLLPFCPRKGSKETGADGGQKRIESA
jgi:hypothetical protein